MVRRGRQQSSFGWCAAIGPHGGVRAAAKARHTRAGEVSRRGFEMTGFDARYRLNDDGPAAVQVLGGQRLLAVLLEPSRPADAEDVLTHAAPNPVLRIPERKKPGLESERAPLIVDPRATREVVQGQLNVVE